MQRYDGDDEWMAGCQLNRGWPMRSPIPAQLNRQTHSPTCDRLDRVTALCCAISFAINPPHRHTENAAPIYCQFSNSNSTSSGCDGLCIADLQPNGMACAPFCWMSALVMTFGSTEKNTFPRKGPLETLFLGSVTLSFSIITLLSADQSSTQLWRN